MITYIYKAMLKLWHKLTAPYQWLATYVTFKGNGVRFGSFKTNGHPYVMVALGGKMSIGKNFSLNNGVKGNPIGCFQPCTFFVDRGAELIIGDNVGLSQTALISHCKLSILSNVKIGGGTCIYTTDFHSLDAIIRTSSEDMKHRKCAPVRIEENVFIGAHCIILKGVTIGRNSIIGAGSVVTKSIPANEIWAGNPAKFIRKIE